MRKTLIALFSLVVVATGFSSLIFADMIAPVTPIETMLLEADYVVIGKLKLNNNKKKAALHRFQGFLEITTVLKGKKETKFIKVYGKYTNGLEGIWILNKKGKDGFYNISNYSIYQKNTKASLAKIKKVLNDISKLKWSKAVKGLSLSAYVFKKGRYSSWTLILVAKNTSEKMFRLTNYPGGKPLTITVSDPNGNKTKINLYNYVDALKKRNRFPVASKNNIKELKAGESTVFLSTKDFQSPMRGIYIGALKKKGKYKISVSYTYGVFEAKGGGLKIEGKKVENLWKGDATATAEVEITKDAPTKAKKPLVLRQKHPLREE